VVLESRSLVRGAAVSARLLCGEGPDWCACYAPVGSWMDDFAADYPLEALLGGWAQWLYPWRLDACAIYEPAAALIHAYHLLTPERRVLCAAAARSVDLKRFIPDRLAQERREALRRLEGRS
jgi:hypothetical protein